MRKYLVICSLVLIAIFLFGCAGTGKQPTANITPLLPAPNGSIQPSPQAFQNQIPVKTLNCPDGQVVSDPNLCPTPKKFPVKTLNCPDGQVVSDPNLCPTPKKIQETTSLSVPIPVPNTSASAITSPPSSMAGINTHTKIYSGDADPNLITLGPKLGINPNSKPYATKCGMEFELAHGTPLLAPIDMVLVGFQNNNAEYGFGADGQKYAPFNDVVLDFESASPDWPGMIMKTYHLYGSPFLLGHYQNPDCSESEELYDSSQAQGRLFFAFDDYTTEKGKASACKALIGFTVKRGELIGYAGSVGTHTFASFCFKVSNTSKNPTVKKGNPYLHWVQPSSFFYWKCYSPDADFPSGVLAYPFECGGYQLPAEQRDVNFKYTSME